MLERMNSISQERLPFWRARFEVAALLTCAIGCAGGETVTPEAVDLARRLWTKASIRDYDLDWTVRGRNNAHYLATVRDGEVRKLKSIAPNGATGELRPVDREYYSVDGLFRTMADDLAMLNSDRPFGEPKGTKVVMRFQPDSRLGYPHFYRRDVLGTSLSISIEVNSLTRVPGASAAREP